MSADSVSTSSKPNSQLSDQFESNWTPDSSVTGPTGKLSIPQGQIRPLDLGPPGFQATITLFEGTADERTIYLGPWEVVDSEQRRVIWEGSYQLERLEQFLPTTSPVEIFPYTIHSRHRPYAEYENGALEHYVTFREPHRVKYTNADGVVVHDQPIEVKYEFTTTESSISFQGDLRGRDLVDCFDVDVIWTDTQGRTDAFGNVKGFGTVQRLKLWSDRHTQSHSLTVFANRSERQYREFQVAQFESEISQDSRRRTVRLRVKGRRGSAPESRRGAPFRPRRGSSATIQNPLNIRYLGIQFSRTEDHRRFIDIWAVSHSLDSGFPDIGYPENVTQQPTTSISYGVSLQSHEPVDLSILPMLPETAEEKEYDGSTGDQMNVLKDSMFNWHTSPGDHINFGDRSNSENHISPEHPIKPEKQVNVENHDTVNRQTTIGRSIIPEASFRNTVANKTTKCLQFILNTVEAAVRPKIPSTHVRVSWSCPCGRRLYLDVLKEKKAHALCFARKAAGPANSNTITSQVQNGSVSQESASSEQSLSGGSPSQEETSTASSNAQSSQNTTLDAATEFNSGSIRNTPPGGTRRYLLLCLDIGIHRISLTNLDLTGIKYDYSLYQEVRKAYDEVRQSRAQDWHGAFVSWFYKPKTMRYIKFTMAKHNTSGPCVNIRKYDVLPPTAEIKAGRYFYKTDHLEPDEFPMHPKIFMHCWYHHHDYTEQGLAVEGLPNKLHHPMQYEAVLSPPGWGIYIVENFDSGLVACIVTGASLIITLFVALWSSLMNDTQGGTGIGQYMLALIGSVILAVGGYLSTVWSMES